VVREVSRFAGGTCLVGDDSNLVELLHVKLGLHFVKWFFKSAEAGFFKLNVFLDVEPTVPCNSAGSLLRISHNVAK